MGIEPVSSALAGGFFTPESPGKPSYYSDGLKDTLLTHRVVDALRPRSGIPFQTPDPFFQLLGMLAADFKGPCIAPGYILS